MVILSAVGFVLILFVLPETRYYRDPTSDNGEVWFTDEFGVTQRLSEAEAEERFGTTIQSALYSGANIPKKSYLQSIKPYSSPTPHGVSLITGAVAKMIGSLSSPAVIWSILMASITLGEFPQTHVHDVETDNVQTRYNDRHESQLRHRPHRRLWLVTRPSWAHQRTWAPPESHSPRLI